LELSSTGEVLSDGENLSSAEESRLTSYRREAGLVFQFDNLIPAFPLFF